LSQSSKKLGSLSPLPFNMLNRLEVHHLISNDVTKVQYFNLLFGILDIPFELHTSRVSICQ
jgi:hypothetical protein